MKNTWEKASIYVGLLSLTLAVSAISALGQVAPSTTGLVLTNSTTSNNPFLWLQDSSGNTGLFPILEVSGGSASQTLGIEVTSQSVSTVGTAPTLSSIMGTGFGGLSLVQMGAAGTNGPGRASPAFAMCANQYGSAGAGGQGPDCWYWQVAGGAASTRGRFDGGGRRFVPQKSVSTTWKSYAAVLTAANSEEDPMDAFAFALPIQIAYVTGSLTQVDITFTVTGGDGNGNPVIFAIDFIWDASLAVADNLASLKTAILNQCQSEFNLTVLSSNVNILMAVS